MADILDSFDKSDVNIFSKDLAEIIRVSYGMNKAYGKATEKLKGYLSKHKSIINLFNKKYGALKLKISKSTTELDLSIFLDEKSVKELFMNAASKIVGLRSIGLKSFGEVDLEQSQEFSNKAAAIDNELYLSYYYPKKGTDTIFLKFDKNEGKVKITFDFDVITDEASAQFKIVCYYALKGGIDKEIDVYNKAASIGFVDVLTDDERKEYADEFDPPILE